MNGNLDLSGSLTMGSAAISEADIEQIDDLTAGTVTASKSVVVDSNKDAASFRNITLTGELDAGSLDVSGDADIDGTLEADAITIDGVTLAETIADTVGAMVGSNTESGITVAYQDGDNTLDFTVGTLNQDTTGTAAIATTVTITDNENTNENNAVIFTAGGDVDGGNIGLESDGDLTYNPSTGLLSSTGVTASGTITYGSLSDGSITITAFVDEDNMASDSATLVPTQQSVKAYVDGQTHTTNATTVTITDNESTNETNAIIFTAGGDVDGGNLGLESDGDLTYNPSSGLLSATSFAGQVTTGAQTNITSLLATDIKIGEDDQTKIDFETADTINFYAGNEKQLILTDGALTPGSNAIVDLGTDALEFKDAYFDGTVEADAITIGGTGIGSIYGVVAGSSSIVTVGTIGTGVWQGTAIASGYIAADAITGAKIADDAIDSEHYADGSIDNAHIADDAIDSEHYAAGSIDTAHIADNQITLAKMAGGTDGNIISYDASGDPVAIATGSDGQVLTSTGAGSPPAFEDASGVSTGKAIAMAMVFG